MHVVGRLDVRRMTYLRYRSVALLATTLPERLVLEGGGSLLLVLALLPDPERNVWQPVCGVVGVALVTLTWWAPLLAWHRDRRRSTGPWWYVVTLDTLVVVMPDGVLTVDWSDVRALRRRRDGWSGLVPATRSAVLIPREAFDRPGRRTVDALVGGLQLERRAA